MPSKETLGGKIGSLISPSRRKGVTAHWINAGGETGRRAGGAAALPCPCGSSPFAVFMPARGKRGYRKTGNPFIKALQDRPDITRHPEKAGFPPPPGCYLPDS